jgi:hypothetical protein
MFIYMQFKAHAELIDLIQKGGFDFLLSDRNEKCYINKSTNWENFEVSHCITSAGHTSISFAPHHHFSGAMMGAPTNFIYFPFANTWITHQEFAKSSHVGSMNIYDSWAFISKYDLVYVTPDLSEISVLPIDLAAHMINFIKTGHRFRIVMTVEPLKVLITSRIDLLMVNESGEFSINLQPFYGVPGSITNPCETESFINSISAMHDRTKPQGHLSWNSTPDLVHQIASGNPQYHAQVSLDFFQPSIHAQLRPCLILLSPKAGDTVQQGLHIFMHRGGLDYEQVTLPMSRMVIQVTK